MALNFPSREQIAELGMYSHWLWGKTRIDKLELLAKHPTERKEFEDNHENANLLPLLHAAGIDNIEEPSNEDFQAVNCVYKIIRDYTFLVSRKNLVNQAAENIRYGNDSPSHEAIQATAQYFRDLPTQQDINKLLQRTNIAHRLDSRDALKAFAGRALPALFFAGIRDYESPSQFEQQVARKIAKTLQTYIEYITRKREKKALKDIHPHITELINHKRTKTQQTTLSHIDEDSNLQTIFESRRLKTRLMTLSSPNNHKITKIWISPPDKHDPKYRYITSEHNNGTPFERQKLIELGLKPLIDELETKLKSLSQKKSSISLLNFWPWGKQK